MDEFKKYPQFMLPSDLENQLEVLFSFDPTRSSDKTKSQIRADLIIISGIDYGYKPEIRRVNVYPANPRYSIVDMVDGQPRTYEPISTGDVSRIREQKRK